MYHDRVGFIPGMKDWCNIHKAINVIHHIHIMKDKNHMIISIDAEKVFDKIQHPFMINSQNMGLEGTFLIIIKGIYDKLTAIIIFNGQKNTGVLLKIKNKTGMSTFTCLIQYSTRSLAAIIRQEEEIKGNQTGKEDVKLSLFSDDMILYIRKPKDSTKKVLELINEFSKVAGYKINIQKSVAFSYANNELTEKENKKQSLSQLFQKE